MLMETEPHWIWKVYAHKYKNGKQNNFNYIKIHMARWKNQILSQGYKRYQFSKYASSQPQQQQGWVNWSLNAQHQEDLLRYFCIMKWKMIHKRLKLLKSVIGQNWKNYPCVWAIKIKDENKTREESKLLKGTQKSKKSWIWSLGCTGIGNKVI